MIPQVRPVGPAPAKIMVVGEAPGQGEVRAGEPFVGASGKELTNMLHDAGILRTECFITNVVRIQPPRNDITKFYIKNTPKLRIAGDEIYEGMQLLREEIERVQPNVIIALGDTALWALTGERGITKWRGSILECKLVEGFKVVPTYHPAAILRKWDWRFIAVQDMRRAEKESHFRHIDYPDYQFIIRPSFDVVMRTLDKLISMADNAAVSPRVATNGAILSRPGTMGPPEKTPPQSPENASNQTDRIRISADVETRAGFIACLGIGWSKTEAICIPFICVERREGYWNEEEEIAIVRKLQELFSHPAIGWVLQNGLYDYQYFASNWGFVPRIGMDTMLAQHVCFAGLPKGLDFISSMYCEYHRYWKDEGKEFHESIKSPEEEDKYWVYNGKDCVATIECAEVLETVIDKMGQREPYQFQMAQFMPVLRMMLRGVLIDQKQKNELAKKLFDSMYERELWMKEVLGFVLNPRSPKQMQEFFYDDLGLPVQKARKTGKPTLDDNALQVLSKKEPLIRPLIQVIQEYRSIGVFLSTFVKAELSADGRARSSYNIGGTETFRWSSSKDAFGNGMNLQNIPKGTEK